MKKYFIFLLTLLLLVGLKAEGVSALGIKNAEYVDTYVIGIDNTTGKGKYMQTRIARKDDDNSPVYCIDPFVTLDLSKQLSVSDITDDKTLGKLVMIANYGYGYENHTDPKWYSATQMLIWRTLYPNDTFYFTDKLNGKKVDILESEMNEIQSIVDQKLRDPCLIGDIYNVVGGNLVLTDINNMIKNYTIDDNSISIDGNIVTIHNVQEGHKDIIFTEKSKFNKNALLFYGQGNQRLISTGDIAPKKLHIDVTGTVNKINVEKEDSETGKNSQGDASLDGASFGIYDKNDGSIANIFIIKNGKAEIKNLPYGEYYIEERSSGEGYHVNNEKYYFTVDKDTKTISLKIKNEVIKKEITIHKEYEVNDEMKNEMGIEFEITDSKGKIVDVITTDKDGNAKIILPYGTYKVSQKNTTDGYEKIDDFLIKVDDNNDDYVYKLLDKKIEVPVPDTGIEESNAGYLLFFLIIPVLIIKKCLLK